MGKWADRARIALLTVCGTGYSPAASGTVGTLPAVGVFVLIMLAAPAAWHVWLIAACLVVSCALTVVLGPWGQRRWKKHDPGQVVLDEFAGFFTTVLIWRNPTHLALTCVWAFLASRALDILKPPPARQLERLPGGWGILLDDIVCSLFAAGLLHLGQRIVPALVVPA